MNGTGWRHAHPAGTTRMPPKKEGFSLACNAVFNADKAGVCRVKLFEKWLVSKCSGVNGDVLMDEGGVRIFNIERAAVAIEECQNGDAMEMCQWRVDQALGGMDGAEILEKRINGNYCMLPMKLCMLPMTFCVLPMMMFFVFSFVKLDTI